MPILDGVETIKTIRADKQLQDTILIVVSADVSTDFREQLGNVQLDAFISKPVKLSELLDNIAHHTQSRFVDQIAVPIESVAERDDLRLPSDLAVRVAARLHHAAGINSVTELKSLAAELMTKGETGDRIGALIARLAQAFDFDGASRLGDSLKETATVHPASTKDGQ